MLVISSSSGGFAALSATRSSIAVSGVVRYRNSRSISSGMTVLELLVAVTLLLVFTGVVVLVSGTLLRFLSPMVRGTGSGTLRSNGLLIDQTELRTTMKSLVSLLEQPGISRSQILGLEDGDSRRLLTPIC